jgi:hypothetical protein
MSDNREINYCAFISQDKLDLIYTYTMSYLKAGEGATIEVLGSDGLLYPCKFRKPSVIVRKKGEPNNRKPRKCNQG